jgi:anti-sigma factor RsiW
MKCERVNFDLLVRAIDQELSPAEMEWVPAHIAACVECRHESAAIQSLSSEVEAVVDRAPVIEQMGDREKISALKPVRVGADRVMRRFGWGMAIAATLAFGIILAPKQKPGAPTEAGSPQQASGKNAGSNAIEIDGETFVALPYSNPDLPTMAPRIVQMEVPVSSLAGIGLGLEQIASEVSNQDRTVLADVLLGADGQPLGVHVVSWD